MRNVALAVAALVALVPVLQLLPITESLWRLPEARKALEQDLAISGVSPDFKWSLAPNATLDAFVFLLPPLAAFAGTLTLSRHLHWPLLRTIMLLAMSSLVLAFLQLGVPAESLLNPFPQWAHRFNGVFANQNHQGISMAVAIIIALVGMLAAINQAGGRRQAWARWALGFAAVFALCALPLTNSRGAMLIAVFAVGVVPLTFGIFASRQLRTSRMARIGLVACAALIAAGAWGVVGWMQAGAVDEMRTPLRAATMELARQHAPLGTGVGAFVAAFEQGMPDVLLLPNYVNHAHNDWVQWWMEAGWLGLMVLALAVVTFAASAVRAWRNEARERAPAIAATLGAVALLLHSWVDYPLRTGSLATVVAVLIAIVVSQAACQGQTWDEVSAQRRLMRSPLL